jgi:Mor family transcriptional regulator
MQKQIAVHFEDGWRISNIAIKHNVSVEHVVAVIRVMGVLG